ncbi:aminotransferase, classes I and II family protein [Histomonas meleagridis]|uniref:aminotransferase, classes I and II family protein n=1 Tax=Histomonas meleagridis TaxID=135588 RepID=UPI00355993DD|nr:aminotransferase, classes I and II family protein [Histomonas meleagridis]KAH0803815.1 aminotransferase, classes I and II family protein [Histomonas meleagridis]
MSLRKTEYIKNLEQAPKAALATGFQKCIANPDIINLGTAENRLIDDILNPLIKERKDEDVTHFSYTFSFNPTPMYEAFAALFRDYFGLKDARADQMTDGSGISSLVEKIALVLCEPGDVVLIPSPCYGCFEPDMQTSRAKIVYIDLDHLPEKPPENAKLLLLTNPGNPYGDIISNQVYALSNRKGVEFTSIAARPDALPDRVHLFYGVSKDWGMAGLEVGVFWTRNEELLRYMKLAKGCYHLSSDTLFFITKVIGTMSIRDNLIKTFQERLIEAYNYFTKRLDDAGIKYKDCDNSLFVVVDLTDIAGKSIEQELEIWNKLMDEYKLHILPVASGFHGNVPGLFRVLFSVPKPMLEAGTNALIKAVTELRAK